MKKLFSALSSFAMMAAMALAFTSCGDDEPGDGAGVSFSSRFSSFHEDWSAQAYSNVKLGWIATDVADPKVTCNDSQYQLRLMASGHKTDQNLPIYWVLTDLPEITTTTATNEHNDVRLEIFLSGTKTLNGETINKNQTHNYTVEFTRYYRQNPSAEVLASVSTLTEYELTKYDEWDQTVNGNPVLGMVRSTLNPPIERDPGTDWLFLASEDYGNGAYSISYYCNKEDLPGWQYGAKGKALPTALSNGVWNTGSEPYPVVYYSDQYIVKCMTVIYDNSGNLLSTHHYILR